VKSPPFQYHRPDTLAEALALLAEHGDDAKVLAGGQSLVPLMAMRMGRPAVVIDIGRVPGLGGIEIGADRSCTIGAMVRHSAAERSAEVASLAPLVHRAMPLIAHRAIRTRGTVVGSIAHADPAAEMPAVALAVGATMTAESVSGERSIAASDFFEGYLQTALRADEILTRVTFPSWPAAAVGSVVEVARRHGDYALVGLVTRIELDGDTIVDAALAFFGAASTPVRVTEAERVLVGTSAPPDIVGRAAALVAEMLDPPADIHGTTPYRKHLAGVLTRRGLAEAAATIGVFA
jgi:aerobic carbon-monoxide dehydrogenase medium subunit